MSDGPGRTAALARLTRAGLLPERAVATVTDRLRAPAGPGPSRVLTARIAGGLEAEVLPGRGFDIGDVRRGGEPVSWCSPIADARTLDHPRGTDWLDRFTGGLVTTCGLRSIGPAAPGEGLHGDFGHLPADGIRWDTTITEAGARIVLSAVIDSVRLFGDSFRVHRTITIDGGDGVDAVRVNDLVQNVGVAPAHLSMLYHVNLGAPLVVPGTEISIDAERHSPRETCAEVPSWERIPAVSEVLTEAVFEHSAVADRDGVASAQVRGESIQVDVSWSAATLPRLYQWVLPTRRRWALGIEPATAPLFGDDRSSIGAPFMEPDETRQHEVAIRIVSR